MDPTTPIDQMNQTMTTLSLTVAIPVDTATLALYVFGLAVLALAVLGGGWLDMRQSRWRARREAMMMRRMVVLEERAQ